MDKLFLLSSLKKESKIIPSNINSNLLNKPHKFLTPLKIKKYLSKIIKIAVASVAGPQRTGKSFLSNRLLKRMTGFAIGPTTMPCTKGLWIWGKPLDLDQDSVLLIMDTEGLNSVRN